MLQCQHPLCSGDRLESCGYFAWRREGFVNTPLWPSSILGIHSVPVAVAQGAVAVQVAGGALGGQSKKL